MRKRFQSSICRRITRVAFAAMAAMPFWLFSLAATAHPSDVEFAPLLNAENFAEIEKRASVRITANAKDEAAVWAFAYVTPSDAAKREKSIAFAEACLVALPASAKCQHALGISSIHAALSLGVIGGLKFAPRARDAFIKAIELDPQDLESRWDMNRFYLDAPGILGGSVRAAIENSEAAGRLNLSQGQLLRTQVHLHLKEVDKAETLLSGVTATDDENVSRKVKLLWDRLSAILLDDRQAAKAHSLFERRLAINPNSAQFHYLLGRAQFANNELDAAIASFERALKIDSNLSLSQAYMGAAYDRKGDKQKAIAALEQFLTLWPNHSHAQYVSTRLAALKK